MGDNSLLSFFGCFVQFKLEIDKMVSYYVRGEIRGYHAYRVKPLVGETLVVERDLLNKYDKLAIKVLRGGVIVGHLAAKPVPLNKACSRLLSLDGVTVTCEVTSLPHKTRYGAVIDCLLHISGDLTHVPEVLGSLGVAFH